MNFPFVKQTDSKLCGLACLSAICKYYGKNHSIYSLTKICDIHPEGISLLSLSKIAQSLGFETLCVSIPYSKLEYIDKPCVLHWDQNHYVILYKANPQRDKYYICNPSKGKCVVSKSDLVNHWLCASENSPVLLLEPTKDFYDSKGEEPKNTASLSIIFEYLKTYKKYLFQLSIGLLFTSCIQFVFPFLTQTIVDVGIRNRSFNILWLILVGWIVIVLAKTLTEVIRKWLLLHITMRVNVTLISDFFVKLMNLPMDFFESRTIGDLTYRVSDHNRVQSFLTNQLLNSIFSIVSILVFSIILSVYNVSIFLIFLLGSIGYVVWVAIFMRKRKIIDYEIFEIESLNQSKIYQLLASIQEVKLQGCKRRRRWEWEDIQSELFSVNQKALRLQQIEESGSVFITEIKNIIITVLSASLVISGQLSIGEMMAILFIIGQLNSPLDQIMGVLYSFQDMKISLERINEIHMRNDEAICTGSSTTIADGKISFKNVSFKYDKYSPKYALKDISVFFPPNKVTAIVGSSGSGKTTLIKLILGYFQRIEGEIEIDNANINSFDIDWLRSQFGVVMQDGYIFTESIARNIAVGDGDMDWDRLLQAANIANVHSFVNQLPLGYNTIIGKEGCGLSQGQKQRILIARAIYKNPRYLILDEATNSLDATNERIIVENLSKISSGKTVVIIAHRLSTVRNADKIIVLNDGQIVETGTHNYLISQQGHYYQLIKNQLELSE